MNSLKYSIKDFFGSHTTNGLCTEIKERLSKKLNLKKKKILCLWPWIKCVTTLQELLLKNIVYAIYVCHLCIYTCRVHQCLHIYIYVYVSMYPIKSVWVCIHVCVCVCVWKHTFTHIIKKKKNIYIYIYIYICISVCMYAYMKVWECYECCWSIVFYSISTLVGYLLRNPIYTYILNIRLVNKWGTIF